MGSWWCETKPTIRPPHTHNPSCIPVYIIQDLLPQDQGRTEFQEYYMICGERDEASRDPCEDRAWVTSVLLIPCPSSSGVDHGTVTWCGPFALHLSLLCPVRPANLRDSEVDTRSHSFFRWSSRSVSILTLKASSHTVAAAMQRELRPQGPLGGVELLGVIEFYWDYLLQGVTDWPLECLPS